MAGKIRINRMKSVLVEKDIAQMDLAKRAKDSITIKNCNNYCQPTLKLLREITIALNIDIRELPLSTKG